jgi:glyoxylase-like metal-dependent hydrolase (beta-lactamase superfamily II)
MIAALQVSLDGFVQGPHGEKDWVDSWSDAIELIPDVDTFVLGGHMYPRTEGAQRDRLLVAPPRRVRLAARGKTRPELRTSNFKLRTFKKWQGPARDLACT